jgi:hypothetical protein
VLSSITKKGEIVSASSPLVGFGELNDNTVKGLTSLLSVSKVQQESKLDGISHNVQMKTKVVYCYKLKLDWYQHSYQEDIQARITILKKWFFNGCLT